jgi:hypothetical protein
MNADLKLNWDELDKEAFDLAYYTPERLQDMLDYSNYCNSFPAKFTPLTVHGQKMKFGLKRGHKKTEIVVSDYNQSAFEKRLNSVKSWSELSDHVANNGRNHKRNSKHIESIDSYESYVQSRKKGLPSLVLFDSKYEYNFICADFDKLQNSKFTNLVYDSWPDLKDDLTSRFKDKAILFNGPKFFRSFKMLFIVKGNVNSAKDVRAILKQLLNDDDLYNLSDANARASQRCFVTSDILNSIKEQLPTTPVTELSSLNLNIYNIISSSTVGNAEVIKNETKEFSTSYTGDFSNELTMTYIAPKGLRGGADKEGRENLIRAILSPIGCIKLQDATFSISTVGFAKLLGKKPRWLSKQIDLLEKLGLLKENIQRGYVIGKRAKCYSATGLLLAEIKTIQKHLQTSYTPPSSVKDGKWNETIKAVVAGYYGDAAQLDAWFYSMSGHNLKDREEQKDALLHYYPIYFENLKKRLNKLKVS